MNNYKYWKNDELCHSGVKGMKWGIRKKREPITSKTMGREERAYRNLSRKTKRLATAAAITDLASRASLIAFSKIPKSSSGFRMATALLGVGGIYMGRLTAGKAGAYGLATIGAHKAYANTLSGKERKKENAKIARNVALTTGVVGAQLAGNYLRRHTHFTDDAPARAARAGAAARNVVDNVVNNVSRVWQNATAAPYGSVRVQKATKTGYNVIKRLVGGSSMIPA